LFFLLLEGSFAKGQEPEERKKRRGGEEPTLNVSAGQMTDEGWHGPAFMVE